MIYLDSAATTLQKPASVRRAVQQAMLTCANPGRGGHRPAIKAAETVYSCRKEIALLFGLSDPSRVVFTCNATYALNIALRSVLSGGGHAVITGYEHNSVVRPLEQMRSEGVSYTPAFSPLFSPQACYDAVCEAIRPDTRCLVCCHVSNVFGCIQPLTELDALCVRRGIPLIIDASQSAGVLDLDVRALPGTAFVCMPGHKSLFGPQGTGVLLCCKAERLCSIAQGGTGSLSRLRTQPDMLPDSLESGTLNVPGIAGLLAGVRFVQQRTTASILQHEHTLCTRLEKNLRDIPGVRTFSGANQAGVLSFVVEKLASETVCDELGKRGFCLRGGLHCAPLAHESAGTLETGTVRASFSPFNSAAEIDALANAVKGIARNSA